MKIPLGLLAEVEAAARAAARQSYSPYSRFPVGAAVLTASGDIFAGCNVENASYGLTMCAERVAVFGAAVQGHREIAVVVVYTPTPRATMPCGACRQVLYEFGPAARVVGVCASNHRIEMRVGELLPHAFGPHNLSSHKEAGTPGSEEAQ